MSKRTFVDIDEVYERLLGIYNGTECELLIPFDALRAAVAQSTTLTVSEPEDHYFDKMI